MRLKFEKEFLKLATRALACRFIVMSGKPEKMYRDGKILDIFLGYVLGEVDHFWEMQLLCKEIREEIKRRGENKKCLAIPI